MVTKILKDGGASEFAKIQKRGKLDCSQIGCIDDLMGGRNGEKQQI
jgi:hypothetical protein